jgi:hypothetical protein
MRLNVATYVFFAALVAALLYVFGRGVGESLHAERPFDTFETPSACLYITRIGRTRSLVAIPRPVGTRGC